jgi:hypothetical protein
VNSRAGVAAAVGAIVLLAQLSTLNLAYSQTSQTVKPVEYLSDIPGSGYEWLEQQQRQAYGGKCKTIGMEEVLASVKDLPKRTGWEDPESLFREIGIDRIALPTRCEDLRSFFLTNRISQDVRTVATQMAGTQINKIVWGSLPVRGVNASAQKIGGEYVVVMNQDLFAFLYSLLLTVDRTVVIEKIGDHIRIGSSEEDFKNALRRSPSLLSNFVSLIVAFSKKDSLPDIKFANELEAPLLMGQLNAIERFIVGHEFGHVILGHVDRGLRMLVVPAASGGTYRVPSAGRDWAQELQADEVGQRLAFQIRASNESDPAKARPLFLEAMADYAPSLFFEIADTLDDGVFCKGTGEGSAREVLSADKERIAHNVSQTLSEGKNIVLSNEFAAILGCRQDSHPPAWLRARFALERADEKYLKSAAMPSTEVQFSRALIRNALLLSILGAPEIKRRLSE